MSDDFARGGEQPDSSPLDQNASGQVPSERAPHTSGKAITSLVLGFCSLLCNIFTGIPAIIFGVVGLGDINYSQGRLKGRGLAIAGIIVGVVASVLNVVLILVALLLPAVHVARTAARQMQSTINLKEIGLSLHNYYAVEQVFPTACTAGSGGQRLLSWRVALLPYLGQENLAKAFHHDEPWDSADNKLLLEQNPLVYESPGDHANDGTQTNVLGIVDTDTVLTVSGPGSLTDITDGTGNTIMAVELAATGIAWSEPRDITIDEFVAALQRGPDEPGLRCVYPGGAVCLFADGCVRFLSTSTDPATLRGLCTRSGGETVDIP